MNWTAFDGTLNASIRDSSRLHKGQQLAERYQVLRPLGRGGMGEVYVASDSRLDREVALKVLPERVQARDERAVQRFLQQARLAARISHPAVVQVFDCGVHDGIPFVAQELLSGETLARLIVRAPCTVEDALALTRDLCRALIAVHAAGVVHRDLKPGNVFLQGHEGDRRQLKLLDFGLARLLRSDDALTQTGEVFGTLSYIAPEQLVQTKAARVPADVYAVACILFELLSGRPPFVRPTRTELRLAVLHDVAPRVDSLAGCVEPALAEVIARALEKRPEQRPRDVGELLQALLPFTGAPVASAKRAKSAPAAPSSTGTRFELLRVLGRGAHGEVCAFLDKRTGQSVALKRARKLDPEGLFLLRREFEVLSGLRHAHIVRAYELLEEPEQLSLVLELVDGARLDDFIQQGPQPLRRLHAACTQLCDALSALHALGLAHRDVKPANVLVRRSGHVVLVDFGLAGASRATGALGSGRYLAPETRNGVIGPACDLYALGVTLADALAAIEPFARSQEAELAALLSKMSDELRSPCPEHRPSAETLLSRLTAGEPSARARPASKIDVPFVGRRRELFVLRAAFQSARLGRSSVVDLSGEAGSGKSALVDTFARELPRAALVLRGRSRPRSGALLAIIDQLSDELSRRPLSAQRALLPADLGGLPALYPALCRVEAVRERRQAPFVTQQSEEVISGHHALREIFSALARETPTVLVLEDVHGSDADERALLANLLREPDPPSLLVVLTRTPALYSAELSALLARSGTAAIALGASGGDGLSFLQLALPERPDLHAAMLLESGDNFHLLALLAAHARRAEVDTQRGPITLVAAFEWLHASLSPAAARLLQLVCLCQEALPVELLLAIAAAGLHDLSDLEAARLVARVGDDQQESLTPYHPRVRAWLVARADPVQRRALHQRVIALDSPLLDERARIEHLIGAGHVDQAVSRCRAQAELAERERRFADSASLYRVCLDRLEAHLPALWPLRERYAYALHCQGLSGAAARALLPLVEHTAAGEGAINEQRASELLLLSGDVQCGLSLLNRALARHGEALAEDLIGTLQQTALAHAALRARGLGVTLVAREACDPAALARAELLVATAMSLSHIDLRGLPFVFRGAQAALELGERELVLKACALLVWCSVSQFPNDLVVPALDLCGQLARSGASAYERALLHIARTEYHFFVGNFLEAEAESERAEHLLVSECVGVAREISGVRNVQAFLQYSHKGDFRSRIDQTLRWMTEAEACGNAYQLNMLRSAHALAFVARDRPDLARAQLEAAEREWQGGVSLFEMSAALFLDVIDRYEGDPEAHHRPAQGRTDILLSPIAQTPVLKGYLELQRAWGTLVVLSGGDYQDADAHMLQGALKSLRSLQLPLWSAVADAFEANLYLLVADFAEASRLLERSERGFRALHMLCLAACARRRRGEVTGGLVGQRIQREAETELRDLGVVRVDKWCRAYFSPFELDRAREPLTALTFDGSVEREQTVRG